MAARSGACSPSGGGNMRELAVLSAVATMLLASCATSPDDYYASHPRCAASRLDAAVAGRCLDVPQARDYLERAQKQVLDAWLVPLDLPANESVDLTFRLRPDGSIQCLSLSANSNERLTRSVVSAVQQAAPFGPLPSEAVCLRGLPVVATFSNPPLNQ